jgi:hypothetical protein
MGHRLLASAATVVASTVAASLLVLAAPTVAGAQTAPSRPAVHVTPEYLRALITRGDKECIQPPKHFDLKALSNSQLALYGLPTRQVLQSDHLYWSHMLEHYKHRSCGRVISMPRPKLQHTTRTGKTETSGIPSVDSSIQPWAGNYAYGARGTYQQAQVTFSVPYITGNIGAQVGFWAGVGGDCAYTGSCELVQAGAAVLQCPNGYSGSQCLTDDLNGTLPKSASSTWRYNYAFAEIVNGSSSGCQASIDYCAIQVMSGMSIYPSDSLSAYATSNAQGDGYDYFDVCNNTLNTCADPIYNYNSFSFSDSATGECIGEEPLVTGGPVSDYYEANFGTEQLDGCYIANNSGLGQGIGDWTHSYFDSTNAEGNILMSVGDISGGANYPLYFN